MNKKNLLFLLFAFVVTMTVFSSCKKSEDNNSTVADEWFKKAAFGGDPRSGAVSFVIGDNAYVTTGILSSRERAKDTYAFNNSTGNWLAKANFPGAARNGAVAFTIGNYGYVGGGTDGTNPLGDFYRYDAAANTWTQIASLPNNAKLFGGVGFAIGNNGYVGTGSTTNDKATNNFYRYNPANDTWTQVDDAPFTDKRTFAFSFVINNVAYVGGGVSNSQYPEDFYKFDGTKWVRLNDIHRSDNSYTYDLRRAGASALVLNGAGYVVGGTQATVLTSVYKYNVSGDYWSNENQAFKGAARRDAVGFSINNTGYIATGLNGSTRYDDNWLFTPLH